MSLAQVRQKEFSFRGEETVRERLCVDEGRKERERNTEKREQKKRGRTIRRWSNQKRLSSKTCSYYEHIKKATRRYLLAFIPDVFSTRVHREQRQPPRCFLYLIRFLPLRSHASFSRDHLFPSFLFRFPFLFSAAHTISLLASAVCEPINQCEIFALARLTEGPPCHLWALKRVANIANKK